MSIFGVEAKDVKREKLPTISQYLKRTKKPKSKVARVVDIVWTPGKFDNFTLQTDLFRVIISSKHPFYRGLQEFFADSSTAETPIGVEITNWDDGSYMLYEPKENGMWQELGNSGYRWVVD
jgi:hypothetical protein